MKMEAYVVQYPERPAEFVFAYPNVVAEVGGLKLFEAQIVKNSERYAKLGEISYSLDGNSALLIPVAQLEALMAAWTEKGCPGNVGDGELPKRLRDIDFNPILPINLLELFREGTKPTKYIRIVP